MGHGAMSFPHAVEVAVPERGLRGKLHVMHDFHAQHNIKAHPGRGRYEDGRRYIRWCFASLITAKKFARQFGGSVVTTSRAEP
jgi:hypothetical protein